MQAQLIGFVIVGPESILLGIAILATLRLVYHSRELAGRDLMHAVLEVISWALIVMGGLGIVGSLAVALGVARFPFGFVPIIVAVFVAVDAFVKRRNSQREALLLGMAVSVERSISLASTIRAFAYERRGPFAWQAYRLANMLDDGLSLPDALEQTKRLLPPKALPMICVGHQSGALGPALRRSARMREFQGTAGQSLVGQFLYLYFVVVFGLAVVTFMMLKIVPQFVKIFENFGLELPEFTRLLIETSSYVFDWGGFLSLLLLAVIGYTLLRYTGLIRWELPGINPLLRRLDTAAILDALSLATRRRQPLTQTLDTLTRTYPKWTIRRRLWAAAQQVAEGTDWCRALQAQRLLKPVDVAVLKAAERVGNLPWAMEEMANGNRRRWAYRLQAAMQMIYPPLLIVGTGIVMFVVVGLFLPLIKLINNLT